MCVPAISFISICFRTGINPVTTDPAAANRRIFVGRLPTSHGDFKPKLLEDLMSQFGEIEGISCLKGFAFIQFKSESSVAKAFQSPPLTLLENRLDIKPAKTNKEVTFIPSEKKVVPVVAAPPPPPPEEPTRGPPGQGPQRFGPGGTPANQAKPGLLGRNVPFQSFSDSAYAAAGDSNYAEDSMETEEQFGNGEDNYNEEGYEGYENEEYYEEPELSDMDMSPEPSKPAAPPQNQSFLTPRGSAAPPPGPRASAPFSGPLGPVPPHQRPSRPSGPGGPGPRPPFNPRDGGADWKRFPGPGGSGPRRPYAEEHRGRSPPKREFSPPRRERSPVRERGSSDRRHPKEASPAINDCEIIATSRSIRDYAEHIESQLKRQGMRVDILFPHEDIPIKKVLQELASRGVVFGVVVLPANEKALTMNVHILQGRLEDHRDVDKDEGLRIITSAFKKSKDRPHSPERKRSRSRERERPSERKVNTAGDAHPGSMQMLLNFLQENRPLTLVEYDKVIKYLLEKREKQIRVEYGEDPTKVSSLIAPALPAALIPGASPLSTTQAELQSRILTFLNSGRVGPNGQYVPPTPVQAAAAPAVAASSNVFSDPSIQKALDTLIQSGPNLFQNLGQSNVNAGYGISNMMGSQQPMGMVPQQGMGMYQYGHY